MDEEVNAILDVEDRFERAALQVKLTDFFEEKTPLTHIDRFICWKVGDRDALNRIERSSYLGESIRFDFQSNEIHYGDEKPKMIPVLELAERLS